MSNRLPRFEKAQTLVLGAATLMLLSLPGSARAQSTAMQDTHAQPAPTQDRQTDQIDDITRRDLAQFDQFLDSNHEIAEQLRRTPSLIDDPQFLQSHPELNSYLQEHPNVKQEISQHPDTFMRLEDRYDRDSALRDRDAGGQDRDAYRRDDRDAGGQDRDQRGGIADRDMASFDRFLDSHREIAEQVRKNPVLVDNREFVQNHPALQTYLQDNPGVRDQLRQDPNAFMRQEGNNDRDSNLRDRLTGGPVLDPNRGDAMNDRDSAGRDRDDRRGDAANDDHRGDAANFDRFLDDHREIGEQVRKDPSLVDNRNFVQNHPALQAYLRDNPGVRDQLRQDPNAFMQQGMNDRDWNRRDRDPMRDRMADFGGFLGNHPDLQKDLSRDPSVVKDRSYMQNHTELDAYLNAHPDVRDQLMANPRSFVQGAQQFNNGSPTGTAGGAGMSGRGTGMTGSTTESTTGSTTGTSTTRPATTPKPNQ